MDLDTATPVEIDTEIARLGAEAAQHDAVLDREKATEAEKVAAIAAAAELRAQMRPLTDVWLARMWTRWYWVTSSNGHVHLGTGCSTLYPTTELGWDTSMSGATPADAVARYGWHVCTVCVPAAPTLEGFRTPGSKALEEADASGVCLNRTPTDVKWMASPYGTCPSCGARGVSVNRQSGLMRKHPHAGVKDAAERKARMEDPKLIGAPDGAPLRVDGSVLRTVRSAEIAYIDAVMWGSTSRNESWAAEKNAEADTILAALAAKYGTTVDTERDRLAPKVARKRKEIGRA